MQERDDDPDSDFDAVISHWSGTEAAAHAVLGPLRPLVGRSLPKGLGEDEGEKTQAVEQPVNRLRYEGEIWVPYWPLGL